MACAYNSYIWGRARRAESWREESHVERGLPRTWGLGGADAALRKDTDHAAMLQSPVTADAKPQGLHSRPASQNQLFPRPPSSSFPSRHLQELLHIKVYPVFSLKVHYRGDGSLRCHEAQSLPAEGCTTSSGTQQQLAAVPGSWEGTYMTFSASLNTAGVELPTFHPKCGSTETPGQC